MNCKKGLTGNQLKILALVTMTLDHVGLQLLPQYGILRILGRLAMPIYGFMIAEGCRHTHDRKRYLLRIAGMAALCQVVYYFAMGSLYQGILVTFSLSICLIYAIEKAAKKRTVSSAALAMGALLGTFFLCVVLPDLLEGTDYAVDYGLWGVLLPVFVYFAGRDRRWIFWLGIDLILLSLSCGGIQWWCLGTVPLLALYNGRRGERSIGKLFYWYYPAHLVVIAGIGYLLEIL